MKPSWRRNSLIYIAILVAAIALISFLWPGAEKPEEVPLSEVIARSQTGEIEKIVVEGAMLTVTTTFIILVVRSSVALSLGLVGALSIVRFRSAIKEPEELAYLFFAIAIGIGLGDNQRLITVIALATAILVLGLMRLFRGRQADFNLHVTVANSGPSQVDFETVVDTLHENCAQMKLMRFLCLYKK